MALEPRLPGLRLALIDLARGTRIGRLRGPRADSQWLSGEALGALQLAKLRSLLAYACTHVPRYREFAAREGFEPEGLRSPRDLQALPVLTKEEMRRDPAAFQPSASVPARTFTRRTGGSTGDPFTYRVDSSALSGQWAALLRAWEWSGYRFGEAMATVGGGSIAAGGSFSHRVYDRLRRNRPLAAASLDDAGQDRLVAALASDQPVLVYGYPTLLYGLARRILARGGPTIRPRSVITTSEMLFPGQRRAIEAAFAAPVFDVYGCNEANLVTGECEQHAGWHQAMESSFVEILDHADRPVPPGQPGRIVATALDNRAMVFVRYDTGDLGALDPTPCPCGRGLVRIRELQGRSRDLVRALDGRLVHGVAFNQIILEFPWVDRYQVIQTTAEALSLNLATGAPPGADAAEELRRRVADLTGLEIDLVFNRPFEETEGRKARVIVSRLEQQDVR